MRVCMCVRGRESVCVSVRERERYGEEECVSERERESERKREDIFSIHLKFKCK